MEIVNRRLVVIYLVGSWSHEGDFLVGLTRTDERLAFDDCDRYHALARHLVWSVFAAQDGQKSWQWEEIHRRERI